MTWPILSFSLVIAFTSFGLCQSVTYLCAEATTLCNRSSTCSSTMSTMAVACQTVYKGTGCSGECLREYQRLISGPIGIQFNGCDCQGDVGCLDRTTLFHSSCYPRQSPCAIVVDKCNGESRCRVALANFRVHCRTVLDENAKGCTLTCKNSLDILLTHSIIGEHICLCQPQDMSSCDEFAKSITLAMITCEEGPLREDDQLTEEVTEVSTAVRVTACDILFWVCCLLVTCILHSFLWESF
ncbi:uncharacterized protein LOC134189514 [Corticium candelabrum]|uniref:uncharacterized protein LOC134189514 n=1 Tax=Corticium candelabrum TaxID=121492 RepID=UPI002E2585DF|nr:uncharacterized protein LOC134189514 [Corticium candelabrum]